MVPMLMWGFERSNFCLAMEGSSAPRSSLRPPLLPAHPGDDLAGDRLRNFLVGVELHGVGRSTLRARPKVSSVAEHLGQRYLGPDDVARSPLLHALDAAAPTREVADDVAH